MLIIAGGYEGGIVGLEVSDTSEDTPTDESLVFRFICSQGSIRCLALGEDFLCCGGTDETVQVYGLNNRKKHGDLLLSSGCVTSLGAHGTIYKGMLLVGNEHGSIQVFGVRRLELLKQLKADKKAITSVSVHPNGELALSVSEGAALRLWDLKTFLCVFYAKMNEPSLMVEWHPSGEDYYILSESQNLKLSLNENAKPCLYKAESATKHICASWVGNNVAVGCRSGDVILYPSGSDKGFVVNKVHPKRIKAITSFQNYIVTGDSHGMLICSSVVADDEQGSLSLTKRWEFDAGMRINSLICRAT